MADAFFIYVCNNHLTILIMKKLMLIAVFLFCSAISFAQTETDLVGKWALTGMAPSENVDKETQEKFKNTIKFTIDLKKDKKFSLSAMDKVVTGTWKLKGKQIELVSDATKKASPLSISKYLKNEMHVLMNGRGVILTRAKAK